MAFGGGLLAGINKGLDARDKRKSGQANIELKREEAEFNKEKFTAEQSKEQRRNDEFAFQNATKFIENNNVPDSAKLQFYNNTYVSLGRKLGMNIPTITSIDGGIAKSVGRVGKILQDQKDGKLDQAQANIAITAELAEAKRDNPNAFAASDKIEEARFNSEKAKALGAMRDVETAGGQMTEEQQQFLKKIGSTRVGQEAFTEFNKGQGGSFKNVGNAIGEYITQQVNSGVPLETAIKDAKTKFPGQASEAERILQLIFGGKGGGGVPPGSGILPDANKGDNFLEIDDKKLKELAGL